MKKVFLAFMTLLGLTACGQENFENVDVAGFDSLRQEPNVIVLDVRTSEEYAEGHLAGALNIEQGEDDFEAKAKATLEKEKTIAVYCRSGRRSASASNRLAAEGYKCVNLKGGIIAWKDAGKPVVTDNN